MLITYDEPKRQTNLAKHGLDFASLTVEFFEAAVVLPGKEGRWLAIGELDGRVVVAVVFRPLGTEALSIASMRPASRKEGAFYDEIHLEAPAHRRRGSRGPAHDCV
ncbi:BrnT family toxin [Devosia insulae]|uniref:BrnT family toxin n=1 Tax=Devosia insulae TaxID=408174 RepID=UPI000A03C014|nr:BrnT family toxin [Devosia insulae]